jgi:hypothetical protein
VHGEMVGSELHQAVVAQRAPACTDRPTNRD